MIIEIFGLPGSGKTTFCQKYSTEKNLKDLMKFYRDSFFGRSLYYIFKYIYFLIPKINIKLKRIMEVLSKKNYTNCINKDISIKEYIIFMCFVYYCELKNKKNVIIDEGIIHYCMALHAEFGVEFDVLDEIINELKLEKNIKYIVLNCSVEKCLSQMKKRNRMRSSIDFMDEGELELLLKKYEKALNYYKILVKERIEIEI